MPAVVSTVAHLGLEARAVEVQVQMSAGLQLIAAGKVQAVARSRRERCQAGITAVVIPFPRDPTRTPRARHMACAALGRFPDAEIADASRAKTEKRLGRKMGKGTAWPYIFLISTTAVRSKMRLA